MSDIKTSINIRKTQVVSEHFLDYLEHFQPLEADVDKYYLEVFVLQVNSYNTNTV